MEQTNSNTIRDLFDTVSEAYDSPALRFFSASAAYLAGTMHLHGDERVIDIATGTGNAALALAGRLPRGRVTGTDFSPGMLAQARKRAQTHHIRNVEFIEMDMQEPAPGLEGFDAATCAFGIFFVEDMDTQLVRIASQVRDGGTITICNFDENYFDPLRTLMMERLLSLGVIPPPQTWRRIATEEGCRELFEGAGLRDIRVERKNMGYYLAGADEWWELIWNAGFRRLLQQLQPEALERFRREHLAEVAALATPEGIWLDIGVLYTSGTKSF